jgi:hypothetical protein
MHGGAQVRSQSSTPAGNLTDGGPLPLAGSSAGGFACDPLQLRGHALDEAATHYIRSTGAAGHPGWVGATSSPPSMMPCSVRWRTYMLRTVYPRGQVVSEDYVGAMSYSPLLHRPDVTILDAVYCLSRLRCDVYFYCGNKHF